MKKTLSVLAALLMLLPFGVFPCMGGELPTIPLTSPKTRIAGDANADKSVDVRDVTVMVRRLAGGWNVTIDEDAADVNGDHKVDLRDVVILRRYLAGGWNITLQ